MIPSPRHRALLLTDKALLDAGWIFCLCSEGWRWWHEDHGPVRRAQAIQLLRGVE